MPAGEADCQWEADRPVAHFFPGGEFSQGPGALRRRKARTPAPGFPGARLDAAEMRERGEQMAAEFLFRREICFRPGGAGARIHTRAGARGREQPAPGALERARQLKTALRKCFMGKSDVTAERAERTSFSESFLQLVDGPRGAEAHSPTHFCLQEVPPQRFPSLATGGLPPLPLPLGRCLSSRPVRPFFSAPFGHCTGAGVAAARLPFRPTLILTLAYEKSPFVPREPMSFPFFFSLFLPSLLSSPFFALCSPPSKAVLNILGASVFF